VTYWKEWNETSGQGIVVSSVFYSLLTPSMISLDFVLLGAAELVLAGFAATLGKRPLTLRTVLDAHDRSSLVTFGENDILVAMSRVDENPKWKPTPAENQGQEQMPK
jgi:hypothetical protein